MDTDATGTFDGADQVDPGAILPSPVLVPITFQTETLAVGGTLVITSLFGFASGQATFSVARRNVALQVAGVDPVAPTMLALLLTGVDLKLGDPTGIHLAVTGGQLALVMIKAGAAGGRHGHASLARAQGRGRLGDGAGPRERWRPLPDAPEPDDRGQPRERRPDPDHRRSAGRHGTELADRAEPRRRLSSGRGSAGSGHPRRRHLRLHRGDPARHRAADGLRVRHPPRLGRLRLRAGRRGRRPQRRRRCGGHRRPHLRAPDHLRPRGRRGAARRARLRDRHPHRDRLRHARARAAQAGPGERHAQLDGAERHARVRVAEGRDRRPARRHEPARWRSTGPPAPPP